MSRPIFACPPTDHTRELVEAAYARYWETVHEHGPADAWDNSVITTAIKAFVRQGRPFSANDLRPLLPQVRKCLISRRLIEAQNNGWIRYVGVTPSTLKSTKGARVNVYAPIPGALS